MITTIDPGAKTEASMKPEVAAVFEAYPPGMRAKLEALRRLILETAAMTEGVGTLDEALKWGQPSYLTAETKSGTTVRIDRLKGNERCYALYVHCQTDLIETYRELYPNLFRYEGNRAIVFEESQTVDDPALRHCIALALTYRLRKKQCHS